MLSAKRHRVFGQTGLSVLCLVEAELRPGHEHAITDPAKAMIPKVDSAAQFRVQMKVSYTLNKGSSEFLYIYIFCVLGDGCQSGRQALCIFKYDTNYGILAADSVNYQIYYAVFKSKRIMVYDITTKTHSMFLNTGVR